MCFRGHFKFETVICIHMCMLIVLPVDILQVKSSRLCHRCCHFAEIGSDWFFRMISQLDSLAMLHNPIWLPTHGKVLIVADPHCCTFQRTACQYTQRRLL